MEGWEWREGVVVWRWGSSSMPAIWRITFCMAPSIADIHSTISVSLGGRGGVLLTKYLACNRGQVWNNKKKKMNTL